MKKKQKKTNNTKRKLKKLLRGDEKNVNIYWGENFAENHLKMHDLIIVFVSIFIFFVNFENLENLKEKRKKRKTLTANSFFSKILHGNSFAQCVFLNKIWYARSLFMIFFVKNECDLICCKQNKYNIFELSLLTLFLHLA